MTTSAILAAGGLGKRFATCAPNASKQFIGLSGRPVYAWSLGVLLKHKDIARVVMVTPEAMVQPVNEQISEMFEGELVAKVLVTAGGDTRQESVYKGLKALAGAADPPDHVLIHDAARPFLSDDMVDLVIAAAAEYGACTIGTALTDTIKKVNEGGTIVETLDRSSLVSVQTPQAGRLEWLLAAHEDAHSKSVEVTDDAAILERAGHKVHIVYGPPHNIKITSPTDLMLCQNLASLLLQQ